MSADNGENDPNGGGVGDDGGDPALERMINEAIEHHRNSRFQQAAEGYWKVMEADPGHAQATYLLGMVMHQIGENEKAIELVSQALAFGYGGAEEYCNLGIIYNQLGRLEDVVECQKIVEADRLCCLRIVPDCDGVCTYLGLGKYHPQFDSGAHSASTNNRFSYDLYYTPAMLAALPVPGWVRGGVRQVGEIQGDTVGRLADGTSPW